MKIVVVKLRNKAPPSMPLNMIIESPSGACVGGRLFWTATIGIWNPTLVRSSQQLVSPHLLRYPLDLPSSDAKENLIANPLARRGIRAEGRAEAISDRRKSGASKREGQVSSNDANQTTSYYGGEELAKNAR